MSVIKDIMRRYGFEFTKSLGQNFLINENIPKKIVENSNTTSECGVIEIGTGFGVLTVELCSVAKKVVAIEIDKKLIPVLDETLKNFDNVKIINDDVLKVDLAKLISEEFQDMDITVCANLPYYITSPIIMGLLEQKLPIKSITVMVQKEAAERICAKPGTRQCGAVTHAVYYYATPKILFPVVRGNFFPQPNVDSAVIRLDINPEPPKNVQNEKFLFSLIKAAFSQRRKTLANPVSGMLSIKKEIVLNCLEKSNLKATARAEELTLEQFVTLSNFLMAER
ncbi:MAG: 16S rRNA (adenine(1518)-N(6)/adenine(1519)-N(6))-dimethyltransferase RsmA [Oscillospiraceae bacterium]